LSQVLANDTIGTMIENDHVLSCLSEIGHRWLWEQRNLHWANGRHLRDKEKQQLSDYYDEVILNKVRINPVEKISNPLFLEELRDTGYPVLDVSGASGMTFVDCLVIRRTFEQHSSIWLSILFHELVHAVQCDILGSRKLVEVYLRGWVENGYQYDAIPLEAQAHRLESRFRSEHRPFSVREVVEEELQPITKSGNPKFRN
jgi:hypothetical protein